MHPSQRKREDAAAEQYAGQERPETLILEIGCDPFVSTLTVADEFFGCAVAMLPKKNVPQKPKH